MHNETIYKKMRIDKHPGLHDIGCHGACCLRATDRSEEHTSELQSPT